MASFAHQPPTAEPESVPIRHAATVMVLADRPSLEVLMVQRTSRAVFGPSAWVFPGGRVDPDDAADHNHVFGGITDQDASAMIEVAEHGRAWWVAGLRETLEEAGLLLGAEGAPSRSVTAVRDSVQADPTAFVSALEQHGIRLDLSSIHEVGRFITPPGPPRRFDARFFVALAPSDQTPSPDREEVVEHRWMSPDAAIDLWRRDELPLMSVTHRWLACLRRYRSAAEVIEAASARKPAERVRVNDPDGAYEVLLPGEPGYEHADLEIEHGWVRI